MIKNKLAILIFAVAMTGCATAKINQIANDVITKQDKQTETELDFKQTLVLANQGDDNVQYKLAEMYSQGLGLEVDIEKAKKWITQSANQGNDKAELSFGLMYVNGTGIVDKPDYVEAVKWLTKSANQNNADAQFNLGVLYASGKGVKQDFIKAKQWYEKASNQNYPQAQLNIGVLYENGQGVEQDYTQALEWFKKSAEQNFGFAQAKIASFYNTGTGVEKNETTALKWHAKACTNGFDLSCQALPSNPQEITESILIAICDNGVKSEEIKILIIETQKSSYEKNLRNIEQVMNTDDFYEGDLWKCRKK